MVHEYVPLFGTQRRIGMQNPDSLISTDVAVMFQVDIDPARQSQRFGCMRCPSRNIEFRVIVSEFFLVHPERALLHSSTRRLRAR